MPRAEPGATQHVARASVISPLGRVGRGRNLGHVMEAPR